MANYLPVLLVSVTTNAIPDDSSVTTLPRGQVDYLSHDWAEEDVWRSWRNMTRQKNEITNGMRLENASWRTWWKQRNKLKTVTPETLNWLKDSDVTWLYGPLHTAVDWAPPPKPKPDPTSVDDRQPSSAHDRLDLNPGAGRTKPILKHRTIGELLTSDRSSAGVLYTAPDVEEGEEEEEVQARPRLLHTKSESHVTRWPNRAFRKDSPPRVLAEDAADTPPSCPSQTSGSEQDIAGAPARRKHASKHITFNTFVEQCIAIEKPSGARDGSESGSATPRSSFSESVHDDGYDEDSEGGVLEDDEDDVLFSGETHRAHLADPANEDCFESDSDSDDEPLEIRTASTPVRARPATAARSSSSSSSSSSSRSRSAGTAPPPARRRPSHAGFRSGPALLRTPSSEKEHMTIAPIAPTILKSRGVGNGAGDDDGGDEYDYPEGTEAHARWYTGTDAPVHLVYVPPLGSNYSMDTRAIDGGGEEVYRHREAYFSVGTGAAYEAAPAVPSPAPHEGGDAYDYFGGPDMGDVAFGARPREREGAGAGAGRYARRTPEVVINGAREEGRARERSRSRSRSKSRTPSPAECTAAEPALPPPTPSVAVPRASVSSPTAASHSASLLSPPDAGRGRSAAPVLENQPRGRSATRGSTSDRERSSSRGTNSPLGSISPEGSAVAIAIGAFGVSANGRELNGRERGREWGSKRAVPDAVRTESPAQIASSSSSNASTATATPTNSPTALRISIGGAPRSRSTTPVPEEEAQRTRHPTPANSPVAKRPRVFPVAVAAAQPSTPVLAPHSPERIVGGPGSPREDGLVGRAVGMAGAFLGAFWSGS
ncbi:hypothetical protein HWV62_9481 [Athelia sp. TMB]|nr:hypothetical protein HWV62_9481 [Athelia sp. TMB]